MMFSGFRSRWITPFPVDHALAVRGLDRAADLFHDGERVLGRQGARAGEHRAQRLALDHLHREVRDAVREHAEVVNVRRVGVVDARHGLRLAHEAADGPLVGDELMAEELEGDVTAEHQVPGAVDDAHPAAADERLDLVAVGDGLADERLVGGQSRGPGVGQHRGRLPRGGRRPHRGRVEHFVAVVVRLDRFELGSVLRAERP
jgi:hypothetical protein